MFTKVAGFLSFAKYMNTSYHFHHKLELWNKMQFMYSVNLRFLVQIPISAYKVKRTVLSAKWADISGAKPCQSRK